MQTDTNKISHETFLRIFDAARVSAFTANALETLLRAGAPERVIAIAREDHDAALAEVCRVYDSVVTN
jgi:hypothetical protein